jgi:hypothetical protein
MASNRINRIRYSKKDAQTLLGHIGYQVIEHAPLAKQGMGAPLDNVGLQQAVISEALTGRTEERQQRNGKRREQPKAVTPGRAFGVCRTQAHPEAQVFGVSKIWLDGPTFGVTVHELPRFGLRVACHQAPTVLHPLCLHAHHSGHRVLFTGHGRFAKGPSAAVPTDPLRHGAGLAGGHGDLNAATHPNGMVKAPGGLERIEPPVVKEAAVGQHRHANASRQGLSKAAPTPRLRRDCVGL